MELSKGRDLRKRGWFWLDDEYLNGYARHLGTTATCVYLCLCRHADKEQTCFPKLETIAKEIGTARNTVISAVKKLEEWNIIHVQKEYDNEKKRQKVNVYLLIDKQYWVAKPEQGANIVPSPECKKDIEQGANIDKSRVQPLDCKETHINNTQLRDTAEQSSEYKNIQYFIDAFKEINPTYRVMFSRKNEREACGRLLKIRTLEEWIKVIGFISARRSDKFCPRISTPIALERKYGDLETYASSLKTNTNNKQRNYV